MLEQIACCGISRDVEEYQANHLQRVSWSPLLFRTHCTLRRHILPRLDTKLSSRSECASRDEIGLYTCWSVMPTDPHVILVPWIISVSSCSAQLGMNRYLPGMFYPWLHCEEYMDELNPTTNWAQQTQSFLTGIWRLRLEVSWRYASCLRPCPLCELVAGPQAPFVLDICHGHCLANPTRSCISLGIS